MRAREFVIEFKREPTEEEFGGLTFKSVLINGDLYVKVLDPLWGNEMGHNQFGIGDDNELDPRDLFVKEKYRGQGVARTMYDYLKSKGYKIHRSYDQTAAGAGFWDKHRGEERVWEQDVTETFDQSYKLKWEKGMHGDYDALAKLPDGTNLSIMFNNEYKNTWMVEFYRNNSQAVTGEGDAQRIFATVLTAIGQFIKKKKPISLFFSAVKEDDPKGNRARLYNTLVNRYASNIGYSVTTKDDDGGMSFKLTRMNPKGVTEGKEQITIKVRKGRNKFVTELSVDGNAAGVYQYDANTGRSIAEVSNEYKGKGYGKILVLHAIYTAAKLGLDFVEDESRTNEYNNVLYSLDSNGYAVNDEGYWYVTDKGEQLLKQSLTQGVEETVNRKGFEQGFEQTKNYGDYTLRASPGYMPYVPGKVSRVSNFFRIEAYLGKSMVAWVNFEDKDGHLEALDLNVEPRYRRKGIASAMYDFAKEIGNTIQPSPKQTALGKDWGKTYFKSNVAESKMAELEIDLEDPEISDRQFEKMYGMTRKEARKAFSNTDMWAFPQLRDPNRPLHEQDVAEGRDSLFAWVKQQFPTWPDYVLKDFLYQQAKGIRDQTELDDFIKRNKNDFGQVKWRLEKLPVTMDIFTPKTQRMIISREGGNSNPFQVPKDAERHTQQSKMLQQTGVSKEPIIVAKLSNGYDLIEGWHRTIQHLKAFPKGYTAPAWVAYGATYTSESVKQGVTEETASNNHQQGHPELDEAPLPPDWDPDEFKQSGTTFKSRLAYALDRARKIGTGSSRVAMIIEYEGRPTVLKIAKNGKGLAQNAAETNILDDWYVSKMSIVIPLIDYDKRNKSPIWLQTELAQQVKEQQLCGLIKCPSLSFLVNYATAITGKKRYLGPPQDYIDHLRKNGVPDQDIETCSEYANQLAELSSSYNIQLGDFGRAANWGVYQGLPVVIDIGFTTDVHKQYYK